LLAYSRSGLSDEEFSAQTETLRRILSYDSGSRSWYAQLPLDPPERAAEVLTTLFEASRVHGTAVHVRALPSPLCEKLLRREKHVGWRGCASGTLPGSELSGGYGVPDEFAEQLCELLRRRSSFLPGLPVS
jgi:hypothetical protein